MTSRIGAGRWWTTWRPLFRRDREAGRLPGYAREGGDDPLHAFPQGLERILDRWWQSRHLGAGCREAQLPPERGLVCAHFLGRVLPVCVRSATSFGVGSRLSCEGSALRLLLRLG